MDEAQALPADDPAEERMLCPACLHPNDPAAVFCSNCDAPLGAGAVWGPFEQIRAQRFILHRAATGPSSPFIVTGVWLVFCPLVVSSLAGLYFGLSPGDLSLETIIDLGFVALPGALSAGLLWRVTMNFRKQRKTPPIRETP
ncbi:MAG: zinc ribbon domain-containing protein [Lacunisphaera sp.]|nr:zinc ribbon domain-containing protein [Lacunisphaera sp.]